MSPLNLNSKLQLTKTFSGKKVFVTGHTGFKGAWLCEWLLALGAEVTGFSLPEPVSKPSLFDQLGLGARLKDIRGDIRDFEAVRKALHAADPDFVFHLAAQPLVRLSYQLPLETYTANVMGTAHVLEALRSLEKGCPSSELKLKASETPSSDSSLNLNTQTLPAFPFNSRRPLVAVMITTDKCYENKEWHHGYRESDPMGGHDPYSSSKGAAELVIASYRNSFFRKAVEQLNRARVEWSKGGTVDGTLLSTDQPINNSTGERPVLVASARAGNVIGGGDWAPDRIVPDAIRSLQKGESIPVRMPRATRPWQHVLEPLGGYLVLAARLAASVEVPSLGLSTGSGIAGCLSPEFKLKDFGTSSLNLNTPAPLASELCSAFNFGPALASNRPVKDLVEAMLKHWPGSWTDASDPNAVHEAHLLNLATDKAFHLLGWRPVWDFAATIAHTVSWYRQTLQDPALIAELTRRQIKDYQTALEA